jgi:hypothetical protein
MTQHYTLATESDTVWCGTCQRHTQHKVSGGRLGRCMEHQAKGESKRQAKARQQREHDRQNPKLF